MNTMNTRITGAILTIVLTSTTLFFFYKQNKMATKNIHLSQIVDSLNIENKVLIQSLEKYQKGYHVENFKTVVSGKEVVYVGDSIDLNIFLQAVNKENDLYPTTKPYIELAEELDTINFNLINIYATIPTNDWEANFKMKAEKVGKQKIIGTYNIPALNGNLILYPIYKEIEVLEKEGR
jgi:hypothetical protein